MTKLYPVLSFFSALLPCLLLLCSGPVRAHCPELELVFIDACGEEQYSEFVVFNSGGVTYGNMACVRPLLPALCTAPTPASATPELFSCANPGNGNTIWVPADANPQIDPGGGNGYVISYHPTEQNAIDDVNTITGIVSAPTDQVIYARVEDGADPGCFITLAVALIAVVTPVATAPSDPLLVCYSLSPFGYDADFATLENQITGGSGEPVVYYREPEANTVLDPDNLNLADLLFLVGLPDPPTVYARIEPVAGCLSATVPVTGIFEAYPTANPASLNSCDDGSGQGTFDLTSLDATVNGGSGATVTYYTDAGATNTIVSTGTFPSGGGTVYATVSGTNCTSELADITLSLTGLNSTISVSSDIDCPGTGTGELTVDTPGTDPADLSYAWTPAALGNTNNPSGLSAGTYTVVVTNPATGCSSAPVAETLSDPVAVTSTCAVTQDVLTPGGSEGIIGLSISGGTAPYRLDWSSPSGSTGTMSGIGSGPFSIADLAAGSYSIAVEDANGCLFNCPDLSVSGLSCPIGLTFTITPVNCAGASDGSIQVDVADGTAPYTIDWVGPVSGSQSGVSDPTYTITDLPAGDYTITVTDGAGCILTETVTMPGASGAPVDIFDCVNLPQPSNGTINSYTFSLTGGTPLSDTEPIYIVEVYDDTDNLTFTFNSTTVGTDLNPGTYFFNQPVPRGTYTMIAIDEFGCRDTCFITVDPVCPYDFTGSFTVTPPSCDNGGGSIQLDSDNGVTATSNPLTYQWSGGLSGANPQNVPPGTYSVTISDFYCDIVLDNIVMPDLVELDPITCSVEAEPSTLTSDDGQIRVDWTGGTPPFDLSWTGPNGTSDQYVINSGNTTVFNGLGGAGTYDITLEDANGCVQTCSVTLVGPPCPVMIAVCQGVDATAPNADDGAIQVVLLDQADPWVLSYTGTDTDGNPVNGTLSDIFGPVGEVLNLPPGTYDIMITDGLGCELTCGPVTIEEPPCTISATATATPASCAGSATGSIELTVSGAFGAVTYDWNDNTLDGQEDPSGLTAGSYTVNLTDAAGCTFGPLTVTVAEPAALSLTCASTDATTVGGSDGSLTLDFSGGTAPYTVAWTGPVSGNQANVTSGVVIPDLPAGTYTVALTDANGCTATCTATIDEPVCTLSASATATAATCAGTPDGSIDLTVTGATGAVTYDWNDNTLDGQEDPSGLAAGSYTVNLTDAAGCTFGPLTVTVSEPAALSLNCASTAATTVGGSDGSLTLEFSGGTAPYTVAWTGPVSGNQANVTTGVVLPDLPAGTYTVTLTDANGCTATCTATIDEPVCTLSASATTTAATCAGTPDGSIDLTVTGANGAVTYDWNDNTLDGQEDPSGLTAGSYTVNLTDAAGCTFGPLTVTVAEPAALSLTCASTDATTVGGSDGSLTLDFSGGTAPYTVAWTGPVSGNQANVTSGVVIPDLPAGTYTVALTDANGCTATCTATIDEPVCTLSASATATAATCAGTPDGSIDLTVTGATGAVTYDWNDNTLDGQEDPSGLAAGSYTVNLTDAAGCTFGPLTVTVSEPAALSLNCASTAATTVGGSDGSLTLEFSGGTAPYTVAWTGPVSGNQANVTTGVVLPDLPAGTYTVTLTDANGCTATCTATIDEPVCTLSASATTTAATCAGTPDGSIDLTVTGANGAVTYDWNDNTLDGQEDPSGLAAGSYTVNLTDAAGCTFGPLTVTVAEPTALSLTCASTDATTVGGSNGSLTLNFSGGTAPYTVAWTGPVSGNQANVTTGVVIPDLPAGTYTVTLTDASGCTTTCTATIDEPVCTLSASATATAATCAGTPDGSIDLTVSGANGAVTYDWNDNTLDGQEDLSGLVAGSYTVNLTDAAGCIFGPLTVTVAEPPALALTCSGGSVSTVGGSDGTIDLTVSGGTGPYTVSWVGPVNGTSPTFSGSFVVNDLSAGDYSITLTDVNGCTTTCTAQVGEPGCALSATAMGTEPSCFNGTDGSIELMVTGANGAVTYDWTDDALDGQQNPTGLAAGTYTVNLTDAAGCTFGPLTVTVAEPTALSLTCASTDATTVGGSNGSLTLNFSGGTAPYTVAWTGPVSGNQANVTTGVVIPDLPAGTYTVTLTDASGCTTTCTATIDEPVCTLSASATATAATCAGTPDGSIDLTVSGANGAVTYDWNDNTLDGQEDLSGLVAGSYTVNLTDAAGCIFGPLTVTVAEPPALALTCSGGSVSTVGGSDGTIDLTVSGGTGPYTVSWVGPVNGTSPTFSGSFVVNDLSAGDYSITLTDVNGCTTTCTAQVGEPGCALSATAMGTEPSCFNGTDGSIELMVTGANGAVTYDWTDDALDGQQNPTGLAAGTYTVNLTDAAGCVFGPLTVTLDQPTVLDLGCVPTDPSTAGGNNGSITLVFTGGTAPFSASWTGPVTGSLTPVDSDDVIADLPAGSYEVTLTDANGCTTTCTQTLADPTCTLGATFVETNPSCFGATDGAIALTVTGVNGALTFDWSDDVLDGQQNPAGLLAGTFDVLISDATGCETSLTVTLLDPEELTATAVATAASCAGASDGEITVTPTGGTPPYATTWAEAGFDPLQAPAGTHDFTVTDAAGCIFSGSVIVTEPTVLTLACMSTPVSTVGGNDGIGSITPAGGTPPFSIEWSDASGLLGSETGFAGTTYDITGLSAGAYQVIVTDANGCTQNCGFTINQPGCDLMVTAVAANPTCAGTEDGALGLVVSGTAQPFTFDWNVDALDGQEDPQGLAPGTYAVTVSDANGCTEVRNFTLVSPAALQLNCQATDETTTGAADGQVTLTFSGGTPPYAISGDLGMQTNVGSPLTFTDLTPGSYEVILTDANGCNQSCTPVVAPAAGCPTIEVAVQVTAEDCPDSATGAIEVSANGGTAPYTITWAGGGLTGFNPTGLTAGTYFYIVTDANGCEADGEAIVTTDFATPTLALAAPPAGICYGGCAEATFDFTGTPPFSLTYTYTTGAGSGTETVIFSNPTETWTLCPDELGLTTLDGVNLELTEIADANCVTPLSLSLVLPVSPPVVSEVTGTYCADTTLLIAGELFDTDRPTGQVVLSGASAQGCDSTVDVNLTFLADPVPGAFAVDLCPGDSAVVHGQVFRAGEPGDTVLLPGGSVAGCDSLVVVTVNTLPPAEGTVTADACPGDTVFVAGRPFTIDDPDGIVVLSGGAVGGCDSLISVVVNFSGSEGVVLSGAETICPGESATLFLSYDGPGMVDVVLVDEDGQTQLVSNVDNNTPVTVTPAASQRYRIQSIVGGTDPCPPFGTGEATVDVSNLSVAVRESDAGGGISCAGATDGILIASATSGIAPYTYAWSTGATSASLTGLSEGTYTVTVTDAAGCATEESATLVAPPPLISEIVGLAPGCNAEQGLIRIDRVAGGSGNYAFALDGSTLTTINALPFSRSVDPGDYAVLIVDGNGCRDTVNVRVPTGDAAILALPPDTTILLGDSIRIVGQTSLSPDSIRWMPTSGFSSQNGLSIVANPLETTVYRLEVRDDAGCVQRASITVFVDRETTLYAPTGFSPNEDGRNDLFRLYSGPSVERIEVFQVFNRWGESVYRDGPFDPFDPNWGWDGTHRGEIMNAGVFVYRAEVTLVDGRRVVFQGDLTLLR